MSKREKEVKDKLVGVEEQNNVQTKDGNKLEYEEQLEAVENLIAELEINYKENSKEEEEIMNNDTKEEKEDSQELSETEIIVDDEMGSEISEGDDLDISDVSAAIEDEDADFDEDELEILDVSVDLVDEEAEIEKGMGILNADEKKIRRKKHLKRFMISLLSITLLLGAIYLAGAYYFNNHFFYNTVLNEIQVNFMDEKSVHEIIEKEVANYEITMILDEDSSVVLSGEEIGIQYNETDEVSNAIKKQNIWKWPLRLLEIKTIDYALSVEIDNESLELVVAGLDFMDLDEYDKATNAYPKVVKGEVVIVEEEYGNEISEEFVSLLEEKILLFESTFDMVEDGGYMQPEYITESEKVEIAKEKMELYLSNTITYSEGDVIDLDIIADWIKVSKSTLKISFDEEKIAEFVSDLAKKYNTVGTTRTFTNPDGKQVTVSGGSYGWTVNQNAEVEKILENLKGDEPVKRSIEYSKKASSHGDADWGKTFAMIDLTNQKMWMVVDGEVVVSSSVVTGDVAGGNATPQGVYSVSYTTANAILRAPLRADGTREYETPVAYWMPFNGGIGFHDATWRSSFGGTIYKNSGSHGCINMPLDKAKALYGYLKAGMPVICHF